MSTLRFLWMMLQTTDEGGSALGDSGGDGGEGAGGAGDDGAGASGGDDGGDGDNGGDDGGQQGGDSHWIDQLTLESLDDGTKQILEGMTAEDAIAKLQAGPPDEYTLPDELQPAEGEEETQAVKDFREKAKEAGLSQEQFTALAPDIADSANTEEAMKERFAQQNKEGMQQMYQTLGKDGFDRTVENARKVVHSISDPETLQWLNDSDMGNNPQLIQFLGKFGALMGEDSLDMLRNGGGGERAKPNAAQGDGEVAKKFYPNMK